MEWFIDPFQNTILFKVLSTNDVGQKRVDWIERGVKIVLSYIADKRFKLKKVPGAIWKTEGVWTTGENIVTVVGYVDPAKAVVIYRLLLDEAEPKEATP